MKALPFVCFCLCYLFILCQKTFVHAQPSTRIIGGHPADASQYPFAVAINVQTSDSKFFCGGTLYGTEWIVTAAQCVNGATFFTIHLGSVSLTAEDPNRVTLNSSEYILHPNFDPLTLENDIGLIKLGKSIEITDVIKSISSLALYPLGNNVNVHAIGWEQTSDGNTSLADNLQYVYVTTMPNQECKIIYGNQITDNMVCIKGNDNEGSCHGDTGGPLIEVIGGSVFLHVGVASFVSGNGCESTDPSGYTRTYPYVDWIKNVTGGN